MLLLWWLRIQFHNFHISLCHSGINVYQWGLRYHDHCHHRHSDYRIIQKYPLFYSLWTVIACTSGLWDTCWPYLTENVFSVSAIKHSDIVSQRCLSFLINLTSVFTALISWHCETSCVSSQRLCVCLCENVSPRWRWPAAPPVCQRICHAPSCCSPCRIAAGWSAAEQTLSELLPPAQSSTSWLIEKSMQINEA